MVRVIAEAGQEQIELKTDLWVIGRKVDDRLRTSIRDERIRNHARNEKKRQRD